MSSVRAWLEAAAEWRAASLMFGLPTPETQEEIRHLAATMPEDRAAILRELAGIPLENWEAEYHRVLGAGRCAACESSYEDNALAGRGPILAGIAGYYEAFAYHPERPGSETPDHLAIELGFLSFLAMKIAFAVRTGRGEELEIARDAYQRFRTDHPGHWLPRFIEALSPCNSPMFESAARWTAALFKR